MRRTTDDAVEACPDDDALAALVADQLPPHEREAIAIHAAACNACHAMLGRLATTGGSGGSDDLQDDAWLALAPGTQIGRFTVEKRLGAGGMGVVYAAVDTELERRVALKLLRPGTGGRDARARLVREARTLAQLSHPNVVTVFEVGEHRGRVFLAMELVEGGNVTAWLGRRPGRTAGEIVDCMVAAGRGLAEAHAAGFVHRDVKPDNILVGTDGRVRVTDFGLARIEPTTPLADMLAAAATDDARLTRAGTLLGTPVYMAPEALRGESTARSDQWSFCATLYELLAGVRPFPVDPDARAIAITAGRPAAPALGRQIPAPIRAVLARGLHADPAARWPGMTALVTALVHARHRRRTIALSIGGVAALGILGTSVGIAMHDPPAPKQPEAPMTWTDWRPGCDCPYSACVGHCVSACDVHGFRLGDPLPGINIGGRQESLMGASLDGNTVLYLAGRGCSIDRLFLARRRGATFIPVDITDQLTGAGAALFEGCCTLTPDGERVILASLDREHFLEARLDGDRIGTPKPLLSDAVPAGSHAGVRAPVLSVDGLTLYYRLDHAGEAGDFGALDGSYFTRRTDLAAVFAPGRRIPGLARKFEYVSGVSSDELSLMVMADFRTSVLVRATKDDLFNVQAHTVDAARLAGWHAIPLAGCQRVYTTYSPGGCEQEEIRALEPVDRPAP